MTPAGQGNLYTGGDAEASVAGRPEGRVRRKRGDDGVLRTCFRASGAQGDMAAAGRRSRRGRTEMADGRVLMAGRGLRDERTG